MRVVFTSSIKNMKKDKIVLYVLGAVVVIGAVFLLVTGTKPKPAATEEQETQSPVSFTSPVPAASTPSQTGSAGTKNTAPAEVDSSSSVKTVLYKGTSFEPSMIEVSPGKDVVFINKSGSAMRLMFDIPGAVPDNFTAFDQVTSVGRDGTYQLFLNQPGIWNFYNLNGDKTVIGTINVQ